MHIELPLAYSLEQLGEAALRPAASATQTELEHFNWVMRHVQETPSTEPLLNRFARSLLTLAPQLAQ